MKEAADRRRTAAWRFYDPLAASPSAARRVGWESEAAQRVRHVALVEALGPMGEVGSLLDAGCGEGALLEPLLAGGFAGTYRGEDLLDSALERARRRFPDQVFAAADAFAGGPDADAVICSGALNTFAGLEDHDREAHEALEALWARTRRVLALDVAVRDRHAPGALLATVDLGALWTAARRLTPVVAVREDVVPGEALLVLRRDRGPTLRRALPEDALARAELHLAAAEPAAARDALAGRVDAPALLLRARADLALGRPRDAERVLRDLLRAPEHRARASLHLAALLLVTRRAAEAETLLSAIPHAAPEGDEARLMRLDLALARGDREGAEDLSRAIGDPFIAREAAARLSPTTREA